MTGRLDKLRRQAVESYLDSTARRWVACLAASRIVGKYEAGETRRLARDLSLSVSQVENLARAGLVYRYYRRFGIDSETRKRLTVGHFAAMGDMIIAYDLSPFDVVSTLRLCADEGISIAAMRSQVEAVEGDRKAWFRRFSRLRRAAARLLEDESIPAEVRNLVREFLWRSAGL